MNRKWFIFIGFLCCLIFGFAGCKKEKKADICGNSKEKIVFFSLKNYFCEKKNDYKTNAYKVNKRVSFGGKSEVIENMEINWETELSGLISADINHSSWVDKFTVDTLKNANGYSVNYQTEKRNIPVKQVRIDFNSDAEVLNIEIRNSRKNWLYNSGQSIIFEPEVRYKIDGWQRTMWLSKTEFTVEGNIITE
jgi:hypothetical protein